MEQLIRSKTDIKTEPESEDDCDQRALLSDCVKLEPDSGDDQGQGQQQEYFVTDTETQTYRTLLTNSGSGNIRTHLTKVSRLLFLPLSFDHYLSHSIFFLLVRHLLKRIVHSECLRTGQPCT